MILQGMRFAMNRKIKETKSIKHECIALVLNDKLKGTPLRTWSDRWDNPGESLYALVAQLGSLNALTVSQLCDLFGHHTLVQGSTGAVWREFAVVDFRDGLGLDLEGLAVHLRMTGSELEARSIAALMPNSRTAISEVLVWCPICVKTGHHLCTMQLPAVRECPRHHKPLLNACPKCKANIPYVLKRSAKAPLFACSQCGYDLAPATREPQNFAPYPSVYRRIVERQIDYLVQMDKLPILLGVVTQGFSRRNYEIKLSRPDFTRIQTKFSEFVHDFLNAVRVVNRVQNNGAKIGLPFYQTACRNPAGFTHDRKDAGSYDGTVRIGSDAIYQELMQLYRAVRRYVKRSIVGQHMRCVKIAQSALWWDIQGERTVAFCPVAMAYLRWRMQWESRRAVGQLPGSKQSLTMLGLVGWIAAEQPVSLPTWRPEFFGWLRRHLIGADLLDSIFGWVELCQREYVKGHVVWRREAHEHFARHHWGCCGGGTSGEPGFLFFDKFEGMRKPLISQPVQWSDHYRETERLVNSIKR